MSRKLVLAGAGSLNRQVAAQWSPFGSVEAMRLSEPDPSLGFSQVSVDLAEQRWPDLAGDCLVVALASRGERTVENYRRAYLQPIQQLQASLSGDHPRKHDVISHTVFRNQAVYDASVTSVARAGHHEQSVRERFAPHELRPGGQEPT